jgi:outer membrane protein OmpA-like peptidoglycan-associated protein
MIKLHPLLVVCSLALIPQLARAAEPEKPAKSPSPAENEPDVSEARHASLRRGSTLDGSTGLLRLRSADASAVGTFRLSLGGSFYSGNGFLCPPCENPQGDVSTKADDASFFATRAQLAVTPLPFLEAHAGLRYQTTSNNQPGSRVIPVAGDTVLGAKAFLPAKDGRMYAFGGGLAVGFLTPTDGVGVAAANVDLHLEGTLDFSRLPAKSRVPLRVHTNLGYTFDNSGGIADDIEAKRQRVLGGTQTLTRVERFGYGINRTDFFKWGLGVEGAFDFIRPFVEWTMDVPVNRQSYVCNLAARSAGDQCMSRDARFSSTPSRLTLGTRVFPWVTPWLDGLALLAAVDIGTGATSNFIEEVAPEAPYTLHFGLGYAFDTQPRVKRVVETKLVPAPALPAPAAHQYVVIGTVVDAQTSQPIAEAGVFFEGSDQNAVLTANDGGFRTAPLTPGEYRFLVKKADYLDGHCQAMLVEAPPEKSTKGAPTGSTAAPAPTAPLVSETQIRCELTALPQVATVTGTVRNGASTEFVGNATVSAKDARGRDIAVQTDGEGRFRFENVPAGKLRLEVAADGYLPSVTELELKARVPFNAQLFVNKRPAQAGVVVTKTELKLKRQVHFLFDSSEIQPDSQSILEEIAEALRNHPEIRSVEIQGHTDDVGSADHNLRLSEERATSVRDALVVLGVESSRLSARGYGKEKPLVRNTTPDARAKNRRVQLMIQNP